MVFALLDEIGGRLNFSYQVVTPPQGDRYFGTLQGTTGGYNGVLGMVERGEAQLSAAILVINEERMKSVNFSLPVSLEPYTLMFERPQELSRALLFIQPFTPMVHFQSHFLKLFRMQVDLCCRFGCAFSCRCWLLAPFYGYFIMLATITRSTKPALVVWQS